MKPRVSFHERFKVLKTLKIFHINDKLRNERDPVWATACKKFNKKIYPTNLWSSVRRNDHFILERLEKHHKVLNSNVINLYLARDDDDDNEDECCEDRDIHMNQEGEEDDPDFCGSSGLTEDTKNPQKCDRLLGVR